MGNCFSCLRPDTTAPNTSQHDPVSEKISHESRLETEELLQTTNLHNSKTNHFDSNNCKKSSNCSLIDEKATVQSAKESQFADNAINKLYEEYKDKNEENSILSEGIEQLCKDLNFNPDDFPILVLAFCLDAKQMCCFTKQEFIHGLKKLNATNIADLRQRLVQIVEKLATDMDLFKQLYRFAFSFGLDNGARILSLDMATSLWRLVYSIHRPPDDVLERWLNFLAKENIRGIQRDTWMMFQNFSESFDINSYDSDEAWPSLFDDFVEYELARLEKLELMEQHQDDTNNNIKISPNGEPFINNTSQNN